MVLITLTLKLAGFSGGENMCPEGGRRSSSCCLVRFFNFFPHSLPAAQSFPGDFQGRQ